MKKFLAIFCVITSGVVFGMEHQGERVQLPSPRNLNEQFSQSPHLADFAMRSGLVNRVGGKALSVDGIKLVIKTSVANYQHSVFINGGTVYHLHSLKKEVSAIVFSKA